MNNIQTVETITVKSGAVKPILEVVGMTGKFLSTTTRTGLNKMMAYEQEDKVDLIVSFDDKKDEAVDAYDAKIAKIKEELAQSDLDPGRRARLEKRLAVKTANANHIDNMALKIAIA